MPWKSSLTVTCAAAWVLLAPPALAETLLERGKYLMTSIVACGNCHTPQGPKGPIMSKRLAGGLVFKEKGFTAYASNITPDKDTGIGNWTDAQIIRATREGIRPDGSIIGPVMPFALYRKLSDRDVKALVAYLRTVKPVRNKVKKSVYNFPLPKNYGPPVGKVAEVPRSNKLAYGAYLAGPAGHCTECHTPLVNGRRDFSKTGLGGQKFPGPWGVSVAGNITSHKTDGIGSWSDAEIKRAIQAGVSRDGHRLKPPMGYGFYRNIKPADMDAIVTYLRSLKPLATPN